MTNITLTENEMWKKLGHPVTRATKARNTNATIQAFQGGQVLWSYGVIACVRFWGGVQANYYFTKWTEYSRTTKKHVKEFCGYNKLDRERLLESDRAGYIKLYV